MAVMPRIADALRVARVLMDSLGQSADEASMNPAIPLDLRAEVLAQLEAERLIHIRDPHMVQDPNRRHQEWLPMVDRPAWYYWPKLRSYLIDRKGWPESNVRAIDRATDRILDAMENPCSESPFRTKGLVVGYVQSGKTANYGALIAKAADCGYRVIIVLTGIHNSLRQQTQRRLTAELVGQDQGQVVGVGMPPSELQWYTFTNSKVNGDFNPGHANQTALMGNNPVLIVAKKVVPVLRVMDEWFSQAPPEVLESVPALIIDDEADQASVNTGGDRPPDAQDEDAADALFEREPSRTNALIRHLVNRFDRVAYVAYTATPFANVLIDHTAMDRVAGEDLYPRSFIVDLPVPPGYYGAERIFGLPPAEPDDNGVGEPGLDVIRRIPDDDVPRLVPARRSEVEEFEPDLPESLQSAIDAFVLAGAARIHRGDGGEPATMLIHTSYRTPIQARLTELVADNIEQARDAWRYLRPQGKIDDRIAMLRELWEDDFRPVIRSENQALDLAFDELAERAIGRFYESVQVRQINSGSLDELDYERDPQLKVIVVGGNRLSRGLTLEGLLVSYYVRPARNYDTLMQMGRWFGYRDGYADLTRVYTTATLEQWFRDLATVELEVREDIRRYELEGLTPEEFGVRIRRHPAMLVTSPLKMQNAQVADLSFNNKIRQTINFPFNYGMPRPEDVDWLSANLEVVRGFVSMLGDPARLWRDGQPMWTSVDWSAVVEFLREYRMDDSAAQVRAEPMRGYIERQAAHGELIEWVVALMGQTRVDARLGPPVDLGVRDGMLINPIERTRVKNTNTLKAIASTADQEVGLTRDAIDEAKARLGSYGENLRIMRDRSEGALLIYPISRLSGHGRATPASENERESDRVPIYVDPGTGEDVLGVALVFPKSDSAATREYVVGSVGSGEE
jgi:hypothetical protein